MPTDPETAASAGPASAAAQATDAIIEALGGIRPAAAKLSAPVTTVQGWKKRGTIPANRHADIRAAAAVHKLTLPDGALDAASGPIEVAPEPVTEPAPIPKPEPIPERVSPPAPQSTPQPTPQPASAPAMAAPPPARRGGGVGAVTLALFALVVALLPYTAALWRPALPASLVAQLPAIFQPPAPPAPLPAPDPRIAELAEQQADLTQRLDALATALADASAATDVALAALADQRATDQAPPLDTAAGAKADAALAAAAALREQVAALQLADQGRSVVLDSVETVQAGLTGLRVGTDAALATLAAQLTTVQAGLDEVRALAGARRDSLLAEEAALLAVADLRGAVAAGQPFLTALDGITALAGTALTLPSEPLELLRASAPAGVDALADLRDAFAVTGPAMLRAGLAQGQDDLLGRSLQRLSALITIRRTDAAPGSGLDGAVSAAEAALWRDDLAGAVAALNGLTGAPADAGAEWLARARARLAVLDAVDVIEAVARAQAAKPGSDP